MDKWSLDQRRFVKNIACFKLGYERSVAYFENALDGYFTDTLWFSKTIARKTSCEANGD